jgi:hypothetical protein
VRGRLGELSGPCQAVMILISMHKAVDTLGWAISRRIHMLILV